MSDMNSGKVAQPGGYPPGPAFSGGVQAPSVLGLDIEAAEARLIEFHLVLGTQSTIWSTVADEGLVVWQAVAEDALVARGAAVNVRLGVAPTVPDLAGMTEAAAGSALTAAGLVKGAVTTAPANAVDDGKVVDQTPAADAQVDAASEVDIVLGEAATVPNIVGLSATAADSAIVDAGLTVGTVTTSAGTLDEVLSQSPAAGTKVNWASAVGYAKGDGQ